MKQNYTFAKSLSIRMRLVQKWQNLYLKLKGTSTLRTLSKLNSLSLLLGIKRKIALTAVAGMVTLGVQAQATFEIVATPEDLTFPNLGTFSSATPVFADVDGDGDQDLVLGEYYGKLHYYVNDNNGFSKQTGSTNPFDGIDVGSYSTPTFVDIDDDGDLDLVIGSKNVFLSFFENIDGVFTSQEGAGNPFDGLEVGKYSSPTFMDVDGDGDQDLVIGEYFGRINHYVNDDNVFSIPDPSLPRPFLGMDVGDRADPILVDLDDDGDQDLVVGEANGNINYFLNTDGVFTEQLGLTNPFDGIDPGRYSSPALVDLDNDGDLDLLIAYNLFPGSGFVEYTNLDKSPTGLFSVKESEPLNIYPNPSSSIINTEEGQLEIVDALGHLVLSTDSNGQVDVSGLASGIYFVTQKGKKDKIVIE